MTCIPPGVASWLLPDLPCLLQGDTRKIFIEFLERSCTAEFSGFLLYKELGRRLKKTNPVVAEIFSLMVSWRLAAPARLLSGAFKGVSLPPW